MKKLLYILLLLPCLAWGQATKQWSITPTTGPNKGNGYPEWYAGNFPGYLGIPYGTNALLGRSADMDGLLYFQLSDSTLQVRIGGAWIPVGKKTAANYLYVSALYFGGSATFDDPMTVINSDSVGHHAPDYFAPGIRNLTINGITHNLTADQIWTISGIAASNSDSLGHQPASYYQQQLNGTGFVKATGTAISYDNTAYVPQSGAFTISGEKQSTYTPLALQDLARLADLELVNTVLTGMLVTTVTTTATIPSGTYRLDNLTYAWSGGTVTIPAQDATKYRYSILYITTPGTIAISNGSLVDTDPVIPTFPANSVEVAIIYIPPVGQTVTVTGGGKKTTGTVTRISPGWGMNFPPITTTGLVTADSLKVQSVLGFFPKGDTRWQKILISGTNIKTINGVNPLGSGNISIPVDAKLDSLLAAGPSITGTTTIVTNNGVIPSLTITNTNSGNAPALTVNGESVFNGQTIFNNATYITDIIIPTLAQPNYEISAFGTNSLYFAKAGVSGVHMTDTAIFTDNGSRFLTTADLPSGGGYVPETRTLTINGVAHNLTADQSWSVGTLTASNFVTAEVPSGSINSSNTAFTLANTPTTGTVKGYRNGMRQIVGVDYTISGTAITYLYAPSTGDSLLFDYQK